MGWSGTTEQVLSLIAGRNLISGMDPEEVVVPGETIYFVEGEEHNLALLLSKQGKGLAVNVFC